MLLDGRNALVYGTGPIGGAVARGFAREGARVHVAGRTQRGLDDLAAMIRADGGRVDTALVDALDESAVDAFVDGVADQAGSVDISFNLVGAADVQQSLDEISVDDFVQPIVTLTRTQFLTTRAAVRHMAPRGSGVVLMFGGSGPQTLAGLGGFKVALDAMEGVRRQFALEYGARGIRVVTIKTGGVPESIPEAFDGRAAIVESLEGSTLLGRAATLGDVGAVAAFLASDGAASITSAAVNISAGAMVDP